MSDIPSAYWMIIIGAVTLMICLVLYYVAMLLRESKDAVGDSRKIIQGLEDTMKQVDLILADVQSTISTVRGTIDEINKGIIQPIKNVGSAISAVSGFVSGIKKEKK
ncbi:MAG: hypothetical protein AB9915_01245 [Candidatus Dojkabacteria bacterium]